MSFFITSKLQYILNLLHLYLNGTDSDVNDIVEKLTNIPFSYSFFNPFFNMLITISLNNKKEKMLYSVAYQLFKLNRLPFIYINKHLLVNSTTNSGIESELKRYSVKPIKFIDRFMIFSKGITKREITPYMKLVVLTENIPKLKKIDSILLRELDKYAAYYGKEKAFEEITNSKFYMECARISANGDIEGDSFRCSECLLQCAIIGGKKSIVDKVLKLFPKHRPFAHVPFLAIFNSDLEKYYYTNVFNVPIQAEEIFLFNFSFIFRIIIEMKLFNYGNDDIYKVINIAKYRGFFYWVEFFEINQFLEEAKHFNEHPLIYSLKKNNRTMMLQLINESDNYEKQMNFDNPVLKLIQKPFKIDYDAQDKDGNTALIISAKMQKYEEAKLILEHGANPSIQNKDKISFIDIAKTNENLKGLITMPNDEYLDPADDSDEFLDAIKNFDILKVKSFLDKGYDPNKIQISKSNKVHPLEVCEDFEIFKLLIEGGSDFMFRYENENGKQKIPVFTIVSKRNKRFFDYMVEKGLNIKIKNEFNQSLLTHYASKNKDSEIMKFLMNKKVDYRRNKNNKGNLPIHYSCKHSNIDVVKLLIDKRSPINIANNNGELPIHLAVKYGTPDIVEILLENNSQFGSKDNQGNCPIHYSIESKFGKEMIETFVYCLIPKFDDIKSIIDIETEDKYTLLCKSLINNKNEISSYLIDLGSDVNYTMPNGNTPLILSLKNNPTPNIIHLLLSKGADINHFNQEGDFALKICESLEILHELLKFKPHLNNNECDVILNHICMLHLQIAGVLMMLIEKYNYIDCYKFAITLGLKKLVEFLIESGADVNCEDILGMTPINYATIHNKIEIAKYLIENGANLEHRDIEGNNAFGVAAKCARTSNQMIDLLLETCDILNTNYAGHSAVFVAIENKNFAFLQHIHEMRPYLLPQLVNEKGYDSYTPKILLVKNNWQYLLPLFDEEQFTYEIPIIMEEKLKDKEKYGDTDILCAIRNRYYTAFIHFYEEANPKPDLNETNKFGEFPLFVACYRDFSWRFINFLLDSGADPTKLYEGKTALRLCIENDFQNNVMHLIQHQTNDIQQKFENGMTYMHIAIKHGNPIFVRFLINANIYPKFVDDDGNSYLHYAALSDNKEIIRYILQYQKDCTLMNKEGMTPLMYAVQNRGFIFIEEYLKFNINFWIKCKDFYRSLYFSSLLNNDTFDYLLPYYQTIFN